MVSEVIYEGKLRSSLLHKASGQTILCDAPVDNYGKGEAFSPTDLLATSAAACALTIMGISAFKNNYSIDGTRVTVVKKMVNNPRRVAGIELEFYFPPLHFTSQQKEWIEFAAWNCPVMLSLSESMEKKMAFHYSD